MTDKASGFQYERPIDYEDGYTGAGTAKNRSTHGVVIKSIQDPSDKKKTMMEVFMYRAKPGVYYNAHGKEVHESLAKRAGYDVERHMSERQHQVRALAAAAVISKEEGVDRGPNKHVVIEEQAGFKLVDIGLGRFWVEDESGPLTKGTTLTRELAQMVFDDCVGVTRKPSAPAKVEQKPAPAGGSGRKSTRDELGAEAS